MEKMDFGDGRRREGLALAGIIYGFMTIAITALRLTIIDCEGNGTAGSMFQAMVRFTFITLFFVIIMSNAYMDIIAKIRSLKGHSPRRKNTNYYEDRIDKDVEISSRYNMLIALLIHAGAIAAIWTETSNILC